MDASNEVDIAQMELITNENLNSLRGSLVKSVRNAPDRREHGEFVSHWRRKFFKCSVKSSRIPSKIFVSALGLINTNLYI